jgi:hypothetical protein
MDEEWKEAISSRFGDLVSHLEISNKGNLRKKQNKKEYKLQIYNGYYHIKIMNKTTNKKIYIHHLVAETFISKRPKELVIDHKDGNKLNNQLSNLQYITNEENSRKGNSSTTELPQNCTVEDKLDMIYKKLLSLEEHYHNILDIIIKDLDLKTI